MRAARRFAFGLAVGLATSSAIAQQAEIGEQIGGLIEQIIGPIPADDPFGPAKESEEAASGELHGGITLPEDALLRRRLGQAIRLAESGRAEEAAQALGRLAESVGETDVFIRTEDGSLRSLRAEVQRLLGESSPETKAAYEIAFGPAARGMLNEAPTDPATIRRIATLYFHTRAGADALYRLAQTYGDSGSFVEAAACLERLLATHAAAAIYEPNLSLRLALYRAQTGDGPGAEAIIRELANRFPAATVTIAGTNEATRIADLSAAVILTASGAPDAALPQDAAETSAAEPFLTPRWSAARPNAEAAFDRSHALGLSVPSLFPSVVGDLLLVPAGDGFAAYDLASGEHRWSYHPSDSILSPPDAGRTNLTRGRLSADGRSVFLIEAESGAESAIVSTAPAVQQPWGLVQAQAAFMMPNPASATDPAAGAYVNLLTALDVRPPRQGNRLWSVGGRNGLDEPRLAGHLFLGPPLTSHGHLYAVAERNQAVRLIVLDADTGRLEWSLDLGQAEVPLSADPQRQRIGATPTLAGGTLLCPTAGGSVVAVDLPARSLLWGYRYPRFSAPDVTAWDESGSMNSDVIGWIDATAHVAGDLVLLTPPEAAELHCLDLRTGGLLWKRPRDENRFVATTDSERVLLVGDTGMTRLRLANGAPMGSLTPFAPGTTPSGRGYADRTDYVLPLSDGTLWRIDLATGSATIAGKCSHGFVAGNLTWHAGTLLSLGSDAIRVFDARDGLEGKIRERLAARPDDPAFLLRRADLHAEAGRYAEAITDCRSAYAAATTARTRNRLIAALLDGVRHGSPEAASYDAELDRLARQTSSPR